MSWGTVLGPLTLVMALLGSAMVSHAESLALVNKEADRPDAPLSEAPSHSVSESPSGVASGDTVRGVFRSFETAAISSEINAKITYLPLREGDLIRKGDALVEFDCSRIAAEHDAAQSAFKAHRAAYDMQLQMQRYQAAGTLPVDQAKFEMEKAEAEARGLAVKRDSCTIRAPFDGRVIEKIAQVHEVAQPNQPLLKILNEKKIELVMMVPSAWHSRLPGGTSLSVRIDETGETVTAQILQSTGVIDPVSQSARLIAVLDTPGAYVMPGMSGTAIFKQRTAEE